MNKIQNVYLKVNCNFSYLQNNIVTFNTYFVLEISL